MRLESYSVSLRLLSALTKKGRRCGLTQLLTGYPLPYSKSNTSKRVERENKSSIFYVIDKQGERCGDAAQALYIIK